MRRREASLSAAGDKASSALDNQGLSLCSRCSWRAPRLVALLLALLLLGTVLGFGACGGGGGESTGTGGLELPSDLTDEQKDAVLQIRNLADETKPLATLVSHKDLAEDEVRAAIKNDPKFAELEALAASAGFGAASAGGSSFSTTTTSR